MPTLAMAIISTIALVLYMRFATENGRLTPIINLLGWALLIMTAILWIATGVIAAQAFLYQVVQL